MSTFSPSICFSIIIPLYNKAPYIRKALESVLAQTYQAYECIIIDDGSTDDSRTMVENWLGKNDLRCGGRFNLLSQHNAGVAVARNNAAKEARGEYLCFLDADDWWEPTFLEEMARHIARYPDAGLYATNYIYYKPGKTHIALHLSTGYINYPKAYLQSTAMPVWTGAVAMPRRVFEETCGFPAGVRLGEDFLLWAKTAMRYPVAFLNKPLAYYNNDVPATLRATRNLYAPEHNMLFLLDTIAQEDTLSEDWKRLFDRLRVNGLLDYWMSEPYHAAAEKELRKVDWTQQPKSVIRIYCTPLCLLRAKRKIMQIGSWCKHKLLVFVLKLRH